MKRIIFALFAAICGLNATAEDVMQVTPFQIQGQSGSFEVALQNAGHSFRAFQVDVILPTGLTLDTTTPFALASARNSQGIDRLRWSVAPTYLPVTAPAGYTYYRVVAYNSTGGSKTFNGESGAILTVNYSSHSLTDGQIYNAYTTNMEFTNADCTFVRPGNALATKASSYIEVGTPSLVNPETHESNIVLSDYVPAPVVDQLQTAVESGALSVDLTNVSDMGKELELTGAQANVVQVVSANTAIATKLASTPNVIVKNGTDYSCAQLTLTDKVDFQPSVAEFAVESATYTRAGSKGLNGVCLPYALDLSNVTYDVYVYKNVNSQKVNFTKQTTGVIEAGTPMLVMDNSLDENSSMTLAMDETSANNAPATVSGTGAEGAYVKHVLGDEANYYKLNADRTGFQKAQATHTITQFRFYIKTEKSAATSPLALQLSDEDGTTTHIGTITEDGEVISLYDLNGRPATKTLKGKAYINNNGKKILY